MLSAVERLPEAERNRAFVPPGCPLTRTELEMLARLSEGLTYKQIAARLGLTVSTIGSHVHNAIHRLGVADNAQAVIYCFKAGWIDVMPDRETGAVVADFKRLERLLAQILQVVKERRKLTGEQRTFLSAFDGLLDARSDEERIEARQYMDEALAPLVDDLAAPSRAQRRRRDLMELLVDFITAHT